MLRDRALAAAVLALAAAVALHAVAPAVASDHDEEEPAVVAPGGVPRPACRPLRIGTAKEAEKALAELQARGHRGFGFVGTGMVCGWP